MFGCASQLLLVVDRPRQVAFIFAPITTVLPHFPSFCQSQIVFHFHLFCSLAARPLCQCVRLFKCQWVTSCQNFLAFFAISPCLFLPTLACFLCFWLLPHRSNEPRIIAVLGRAFWGSAEFPCREASALASVCPS
eukprot:m.294183 g.294183  ORF g.294183 m.294183 type:complete len:135 (-) comp12942_c0_seq1:87-491(-)